MFGCANPAYMFAHVCGVHVAGSNVLVKSTHFAYQDECSVLTVPLNLCSHIAVFPGWPSPALTGEVEEAIKRKRKVKEERKDANGKMTNNYSHDMALRPRVPTLNICRTCSLHSVIVHARRRNVHGRPAEIACTAPWPRKLHIPPQVE